MAEKSPIQWTDATWNPVTGCTQIPGAHGTPSGCDNCYAKRLIDSRMSKNPKSVRFDQSFEVVMLHDSRLRQPYSWHDRRIFVNSLSDLFHADVPTEFIARVFETMGNTVFCPYRNTYQILTKRPERMRRLMPQLWYAADPRASAAAVTQKAIWLGVSISTMADAWRAQMLRETEGMVRFLSLEPLLGPIDAWSVLQGMSWVIVGGESGAGARPMQIEWAREIRDVCAQRGIPFFFKQLGKVANGGKGHGGDLLEIPLDLRLRQYPKAVA